MDGGKTVRRIERNGVHCNLIEPQNDTIGFFTIGDFSYMKINDWYMWVTPSGQMITSDTIPTNYNSPGIDQGVRHE